MFVRRRRSLFLFPIFIQSIGLNGGLAVKAKSYEMDTARRWISQEGDISGSAKATRRDEGPFETILPGSPPRRRRRDWSLNYNLN